MVVPEPLNKLPKGEYGSEPQNTPASASPIPITTHLFEELLIGSSWWDKAKDFIFSNHLFCWSCRVAGLYSILQTEFTFPFRDHTELSCHLSLGTSKVPCISLAQPLVGTWGNATISDWTEPWVPRGRRRADHLCLCEGHLFSKPHATIWLLVLPRT